VTPKVAGRRIFPTEAAGMLAVILILRLLLVAVPLNFPEGGILVDSEGYLRLARAIQETGSYRDPFKEDLYRPPGYPLFIAAARLGSGTATWPVVLLQLIVSGVASLLLAGAAGRIGHPRVGMASAFIYALSPAGCLWALTIMSETLFAFLLVLGVYLLMRFLQDGRHAWVGLAGLTLGVASMVRPIGVFLIPVWAGILVVRGLRGRLRPVLTSAVVLVVAGSLPIATWMIRNAAVHGELVLSTVGTRTFYAFNLAVVMAEVHGITRDQAATQIALSENPEGLAKEVITAHPVVFLAEQIRGVVRTLLGAEPRAWVRLFGVEGDASFGVISSALSGDFGEAVRRAGQVLESPQTRLVAPLVILAVLFSVAAFALAAAGVRHGLAKGGEFATFTLIVTLTMLYLVGVPGAAGQGRFRMQAEPLLAMLAGLGWVAVRTRGAGMNGGNLLRGLAKSILAKSR